MMNHRSLKQFLALCWVVVLISALFVKPVIANQVLQTSNTIWYVSPSGDGTNGLSWQTAYNDLQDALASALEGDEIWVAAGVYKPGMDRTDSFHLVPGVALYGGFVGNELTREERDWEVNLTILSGDIDENDSNTDGDFIAETSADLVGDNSYHVVYVDGTIASIFDTTIFDGFIITAGMANGSEFNDRGGGFYCDGSGEGSECSPRLQNVDFYGNEASLYGGAMYNDGSYGGVGNPQMVNMYFEGNVAGYSGGAIFNNGDSGYSSPRLETANFIKNSAGFSGGAINNYGHNQGVSDPAIINTNFYKNSATQGGAIISSGHGYSLTNFINVIMWENSAVIGSQLYNVDASIIFVNSIVQGGVNGDGIYGWVNDWEGSNLDDDPLFVDAENGDFQLQIGSPAIDAGINANFISAVDLAGNPRIVDGDFSGEAVVDIGAYEASIPCPSGSILYVDTHSPHPLLGEQWQTAFHDLQYAFNVARFCENITEVWVKAGVYTPGTEKEDSFHLAPGVAVYGGFTGNELTQEERNWKTNSTILSGDVDGNDVNSDGNFIAETIEDIVGENSLQVVDLDGTETEITETTILDGFIITAGLAYDYRCGAGMQIGGTKDLVSKPILENLIFTGNYSSSAGGALCNISSSPTIENVTFISNEAMYGGAISNSGDRSLSSPYLSRVLFINNVAVYGGAVYNDGFIGISSPVFENVKFLKNVADWGGAMYNSAFDGDSSPSFKNVLFFDNSAFNGGAVFNLSGDGTSNPNFVNVTFSKNFAKLNGGAIYSQTLRDGISNPLITNVIFWGNTAGDEGNQIYNDEATFEIKSSIFEGGLTEPGGVNDPSTVTDLGGNLDIDPLFVDANNGNYHLLINSPAIDSGSNDAVTLLIDLDGNTRITDGDQNGTDTVDMGAYEFHGYTLFVSATGNGAGTISSNPGDIVCEDECDQDFEYNTLVTLTAVPGQESKFLGWRGACTNITGDCVVTMDDSKSVTALFGLNQYPLSVSKNGTGVGSINSFPDGIICGEDCSENFDYNTVVTLSVTPEQGSVFQGWSGACTNTTGDCVVTVDEAKSVTVTFALNQYDLTVNLSGTGSGLIISSPEGINCGLDCQEKYDFNTEVTLTATPEDGSTFVGWSGACTNTTGDCVVTMDEAKSVTANFTLNQYDLTVNLNGTGSGLVTSGPVGINCGLDCQEEYDFNTEVTLTAAPEDGSIFTGWSGACTNTTGDCVVTVDEAKSVTATFTLNQYDLTVNLDGTGSGEVSSSPAGISCGVDCQESYNYDTEVTLTATPEDGSTFVGWSGACTNTTGDCVVILDEAKSVTANFTLNQYDLTVNLDGTGNGFVTSSPVGINCGLDCQEKYNFNTEVTLTATSEDGSTFAGWNGACTNITGDCVVFLDEVKSVTANFTLNQYELIVNLGGTGSGFVTSSPEGINCGANCQESYDYNTEVTLTAAPEDGSTFAGWNGACTNTTGDCVVILDEVKSVTATFTKKEYQVFLPMLIR
ncbi:MAG: hypothetical protein CL609_03895 [Anaerolineaceae bacterium]|nr:hypothetical protein [Anaerolineaceae bacterium]